jgi:hypothetical protein
MSALITTDFGIFFILASASTTAVTNCSLVHLLITDNSYESTEPSLDVRNASVGKKLGLA